MIVCAYYDAVELKQIFMYSPTHPIDNTELTLMIERIELIEPTLAKLEADAKLKPLNIQNADMTDATDKNPNTDKKESIE